MAYYNGRRVFSVVSVIGGDGTPIDVATAGEMDALLVAENVGKAYRYTGTSTANYTNGDIYVVEED